MAKLVLVCVTGQKTCESLILEGARIAAEEGASMSVLHVVKPGAAPLGSQKEGDALEYLFRIASEHDAGMSMIRSDDVAETIVKQVEKLGASILVMGRTTGMKERRVTAILADRVPGVRVQLVYE